MEEMKRANECQKELKAKKMAEMKAEEEEFKMKVYIYSIILAANTFVRNSKLKIKVVS